MYDWDYWHTVKLLRWKENITLLQQNQSPVSRNNISNIIISSGSKSSLKLVVPASPPSTSQLAPLSIPLNWAKSGEEDLASTATSPKGPVTNEHQFTCGNSAKKRRSILPIFVYTAESSRRPNEIITSSLPPAFTDEESTGGMVCALLSLPSPLTWPTGDEVPPVCNSNEKLSPEGWRGEKGRLVELPIRVHCFFSSVLIWIHSCPTSRHVVTMFFWHNYLNVTDIYVDVRVFTQLWLC